MILKGLCVRSRRAGLRLRWSSVPPVGHGAAPRPVHRRRRGRLDLACTYASSGHGHARPGPGCRAAGDRPRAATDGLRSGGRYCVPAPAATPTSLLRLLPPVLRHVFRRRRRRQVQRHQEDRTTVFVTDSGAQGTKGSFR